MSAHRWTTQRRALLGRLRAARRRALLDSLLDWATDATGPAHRAFLRAKLATLDVIVTMGVDS